MFQDSVLEVPLGRVVQNVVIIMKKVQAFLFLLMESIVGGKLSQMYSLSIVNIAYNVATKERNQLGIIENSTFHRANRALELLACCSRDGNRCIHYLTLNVR